jgi:hypothetical protein
MTYPLPGEPLKEGQSPGASCSNCGTSAVDCQRHFVATDQRYWCCPLCQLAGPRALHTVVEA